MGENKVKIVLDIDDNGSVKIQKFGDVTEKTFSKIESHGSSVVSSLKRIGETAAGVFTAQKIEQFGRAVLELGRSTIAAYVESEKAENALRSAMEQRGTYTEQALAHNLAYAESLQDTTVYSHEQTEAVQKSLTYYGAEGEMLDKLTKATIDFASAKGMDLAEAGNMVAKAMINESGALGRLGIKMDGAAGSTERMKNIVADLTDYFGGAAAREMDTMYGKTMHMKNSMDEVKDSIGGALAIAINPMIDAIAADAKGTAEWVEQNERLVQAPIKSTMDLWKEGIEGVHGAVDGVTAAWHVLFGLPWEKITEKLDRLTPGYGKRSALEQHRANRKTSSGLTTAGFADRNNEIPAPPAEEKPAAPRNKKNPIPEIENDKARRAVEAEQKKIEDENWREAVDQANQLRRIKEISASEAETIAGLELRRGEEAVQLAKDRADAYARMYKDIYPNAAEYYNFELEALDKQRQAYFDLTKDKELTDAWYARKKKELDRTVDISSQDLVAGFKAGYSEMEDSLYSWGKAGEEAFKTFQTAGQDLVSNSLFSFMKGEMDSFDDYWKSFCDSLLRSFTDSVSQMAVQGALGQAGSIGSGIIDWLFPSAHGNVFQNGSPVPFARGGLISRPTIFPMARGGLGLAGEAGTEAILPLKRLGNGNLGVESSGSGGVTVNVINNGSSTHATVKQTTTANGGMQLDVLIDEIMAGKIAGKGKTRRALQSTFGLRPTITRR